MKHTCIFADIMNENETFDGIIIPIDFLNQFELLHFDHHGAVSSNDVLSGIWIIHVLHQRFDGLDHIAFFALSDLLPLL